MTKITPIVTMPRAPYGDFSDAGGRGGGDDREFGGRSHAGWIVCSGTTRDVSHGTVKCPQRGMVSPDECLGCHSLMTVAGERNLRFACTTAE